MTKRVIIIKGGPGSGHFGHAGRPGKRGGSAPSGGGSGAIDANWTRVAGGGPTLVYHGTSEEFGWDIRYEGLKASDVPRYGFGSDHEQPKAVFFTADEFHARNYGEGNSMRGETYAIVAIEIPEEFHSRVKFDQFEADNYGAENGFYIEQNIPPEWVKQVTMYRNDGPGRYTFIENLKEMKYAGEVVYVPVILRDDTDASPGT